MIGMLRKRNSKRREDSLVLTKVQQCRLILTDILFASLQCNWQELKFIPSTCLGVNLAALQAWKVLQTSQNQMMRQWRAFWSLSYMFAFLPLMELQKERPRWHTIYMGKLEIPVVESFNVSLHFILFGNLLIIWAVIWGDVIFLLFLVCSADLHILCSGSTFSHHIKFYSFRVAQDLGCLLFTLPPGWKTR